MNSENFAPHSTRSVGSLSLEKGIIESRLIRFNELLDDSIGEAVQELLTDKVLEALYLHLIRHHAITREELPYRLTTLYQVLENTFGVRGAKSIGKVAARKFYARMNLEFIDKPEHTLYDYIEEAKQAAKTQLLHSSHLRMAFDQFYLRLI